MMRMMQERKVVTGFLLVMLFMLIWTLLVMKPNRVYAAEYEAIQATQIYAQEAPSADTGQELNIENTAKRFYEEVGKPILWVAAAALVIMGVFFMFSSRGNPEKARQARMGIAAVLIGVVICFNAFGILNWVRALIPTSGG
jgi:hypothetical protein